MEANKGTNAFLAKNVESSVLKEKRLGLYVLMGSITYILTIKNRSEKGWLEQPYSLILVLFRAGPLGGMILMIPNMISSLKIQIQNFCQVIITYHRNVRVDEIDAIVKELFPNLDRQFACIEILRKYFVKGLFFLCIGESMSEISMNYSEKTDTLSSALPYISSILRSAGFTMLCVGMFMDFQKAGKKMLLILTVTTSSCFICFYFVAKAIFEYLASKTSLVYYKSMMGRIINIDLFDLFFLFEIVLTATLFNLSVLRKAFNHYASGPSKVSPIIGSFFILTSTILRSFHTKGMNLPYYIPYLEIGPLIWGSFVLTHSIAFYVRYESLGNKAGDIKNAPCLTSNDKKSQ